MRGILGKKVGMTQLFDKSGAAIPVTIIEAGPCFVTQVKTADTKDKYNAVQLGFEEVAERKLTKGERGHLGKAGAPNLRHLHEFRYVAPPPFAVGDVIKADVFSASPGCHVSQSPSLNQNPLAGNRGRLLTKTRSSLSAARAAPASRLYFVFRPRSAATGASVVCFLTTT